MPNKTHFMIAAFCVFKSHALVSRSHALLKYGAGVGFRLEENEKNPKAIENMDFKCHFYNKCLGTWALASQTQEVNKKVHAIIINAHKQIFPQHTQNNNEIKVFRVHQL